MRKRLIMVGLLALMFLMVLWVYGIFGFMVGCVASRGLEELLGLHPDTGFLGGFSLLLLIGICTYCYALPWEIKHLRERLSPRPRLC
jgi:hypothetical protein